MTATDVCPVICGCCIGFLACRIYLWHMRRTIQKSTSLWRSCLLRLICVALFFGFIFHVSVPAGISSFVAFILTRNFILFKESRGVHGKL